MGDRLSRRSRAPSDFASACLASRKLFHGAGFKSCKYSSTASPATAKFASSFGRPVTKPDDLTKQHRTQPVDLPDEFPQAVAFARPFGAVFAGMAERFLLCCLGPLFQENDKNFQKPRNVVS